MAVRHSIIIENNYGNRTIASTLGARTTVPGIDRVDFDPRTGQSRVVWENDTVAIPSVVTQLSTWDGLVYTYAKDAKGWYFAALDLPGWFARRQIARAVGERTRRRPGEQLLLWYQHWT